jgi:hypothetical protein
VLIAGSGDDGGCGSGGGWVCVWCVKKERELLGGGGGLYSWQKVGRRFGLVAGCVVVCALPCLLFFVLLRRRRLLPSPKFRSQPKSTRLCRVQGESAAANHRQRCEI